MQNSLTFLGIESSCDDTAAAIVRDRPGDSPEILSSIVANQTNLHARFGGIVPEIAARAHAEKLDRLIESALSNSGANLHRDIDAIAVTAGPGLIGGVISGVMCAKGLSAATGLPLVGVNHLAGHALTPRLTDLLDYPYLTLLASGGHCQFLIVRGPDAFERLGGTIDDAPGEAFDKVARLLRLPPPGGPSIEKEARAGNPDRFVLPRPLLDRSNCNLSFSGLKTATLKARNDLVAANGGLREEDRADLCASFESAVSESLARKSRLALSTYLAYEPRNPAFAVTGGVAANQSIRASLGIVAQESGVHFVAPTPNLCTDNAAMIAWAGMEKFRLGLIDDMTLPASPRWPLDASRPAMLGSGKRGAKA